MKVIRVILAVLVVLAFSAAMVFCFWAGAPGPEDPSVLYMVMSVLFSLLASATLTFCFCYIAHLQRKLEEMMTAKEQ